MSWTKLDDRWTDSAELRDLSTETRWHYLCMIQFCSRTATYDGLMRARDARRCSDVEEPGAALAALAEVGLIVAEGDKIRVLRIDQHVPPPSVRENAEKSKVRMRRHRMHKNGDHSECLPESCPDAPVGSTPEAAARNATGGVTRNTGTGQDRTGQDKAGVTSEANRNAEVTSWPTAVPGAEAVDQELISDFTGAGQGPTYCRVGGCANRPLPGVDECTEHRPDREAAESAREREIRTQQDRDAA